MRTIPLTIVLLSLGVLFGGAGTAHAITTLAGFVQASDPSQVTVSGQRYPIDADSELLDRGGQRISTKELIPGTQVDLEIGDDGNLTVLHAYIVR